MKISVCTGSRLHFGLICGSQETGWEFGGLGLMLRNPSWRLECQPCSELADRISANSETTHRLKGFLAILRTCRSVDPLDISVTSEIPFHTGFGGGTQLGLAVAAAVEMLQHRRTGLDAVRLSELVRRAERSAIGTAGFQMGGLLIDYGQPSASETQRRIERISVPDHWRFVLVRPGEARGLSGEQEQRFFRQKIRMPSDLVRFLKDLILGQIEPSVRESRFPEFSRSLEEYGRMVGSFYATEQGDVFAHPAIRRLVAQLRQESITGAAQSSWGPGICIPAESDKHASAIVKRIPKHVESVEMIVSVSEPLNTGAGIRTMGVDERSATRFA